MILKDFNTRLADLIDTPRFVLLEHSPVPLRRIPAEFFCQPERGGGVLIVGKSRAEGELCSRGGVDIVYANHEKLPTFHFRAC